jgi:hypothetical protein
MKTRVIQDEPKPTEAAPPAPEAEQNAGEQAAVDPPHAPEQEATGAKP